MMIVHSGDYSDAPISPTGVPRRLRDYATEPQGHGLQVPLPR